MRLAARFIAAFLFVAAFPMVLSPSATAHADDATTEMARQRFREGVQFYDQRQYEKARLAFLQAYALKPHPSVLLNLAQSELRADKPADAAGHFAQYLQENPDVGEAERQEAELGFAAARSKVGEVTLSVDTDGAEITVDGQPKGAAPLERPLYLLPGEHTIEARKGGRTTATTVNVRAGQATSASLRLRGAAGPAGGAAPSPAEPSEPDTLGSDSDMDDYRMEVSTAGSRKPFVRWFAETPVAWVGAGLAVAGLGGGGALALAARADFNSANSTRDTILTERDRDVATAGDNSPLSDGFAPCDLNPGQRVALGEKAGQYDTACNQFNDRESAAKTKKTLAIVGAGVGGAALVGTIVYYFVDPGARVEETADAGSRFRARLVPVTTREMQGLYLVGQF